MMKLSQDYFSLLGLEPSYRPDFELLNRNYLNLQKKFHPDNFAAGSRQEKLLAVQMTSLINDAHRVLSEDVARAEYLLQLLGEEPDSDSETIQDMEFLQKQMELREELAQLDEDFKLNDFIRKIEDTLANLGEEFAGNLKQNPAKARELISRLKFYQKLKTEAKRRI